MNELKIINSMEFIDNNADGKECSSVTVEDNSANREILRKIGIEDENIKGEGLVDSDGYINVAPIAFRYSNWFNGDLFVNLEDNPIKKL